jgi:hypothetical protein
MGRVIAAPPPPTVLSFVGSACPPLHLAVIHRIWPASSFFARHHPPPRTHATHHHGPVLPTTVHRQKVWPRCHQEKTAPPLGAVRTPRELWPAAVAQGEREREQRGTRIERERCTKEGGEEAEWCSVQWRDRAGAKREAHNLCGC